MVTVDAAIEFIRKQARSPKPFLAVVWFGSPHGPHQAIEQDRALYRDHSERLQHFYGEITGMDRAFGKLRKELRKLDIHENTILWYCSDNGGLPKVGTTGGRANKGRVYEGGLRVPAILEWPAHIRRPWVTDVPCNTSDIYPTLLQILGVKLENQPPLDGISLAPLIAGEMESRPKPMGFWDHPTRGIRTPSKEWMADLLKAQKAGKEIAERSRLRLDAGKIVKKYPEDTFPGHAAWLDWPWKLHRVETKKGVRLELYNLVRDPQEKNNLVVQNAERVSKMKAQLEKWLKSVVRSLNGEDY
jgi:arylsulfatase A-like enzyme